MLAVRYQSPSPPTVVDLDLVTGLELPHDPLGRLIRLPQALASAGVRQLLPWSILRAPNS